MGRKLSELSQQNSATQEEYLLIDKDNAQESHKIKLKDIDIVNFLNGELVNEVKYAMKELGGASLYDGIQKLFKNIPNAYFTDELTENEDKKVPYSKTVYEFVKDATEIKKLYNKPYLYDLKDGWYYINEGFTYNANGDGVDLTYALICKHNNIRYWGIDNTGTIFRGEFGGDINGVENVLGSYSIVYKPTKTIGDDPTDDETPTAKAVFDFVNQKTDIQTSIEPKIWELEKGLHYIVKGLYVNEGKYVKIRNGVLIFKSGGKNTTCDYFGLGIGIIGNNSINTIYGDCMLVDGVWSGDINVKDFVDEINGEYPRNYNVPTEKAIVDYISTLKHIETLSGDIEIKPDFPSGIYYINEGSVKLFGNFGNDGLLYYNLGIPAFFIHNNVGDGRYFGMCQEFVPYGDGTYNAGHIMLYDSQNGMVKVLADRDYVDDKIASLVDSAPEALDTLAELSKALGDNPKILETLATKKELSDSKEEISKSLTYVDDKINNITNLISDELTDDGKTGDKLELPTSKAVYDLVQNEKLPIVTNPNLYELSQGWYIVQTGFYYNNDNSQYQKINDILTMLVEQGDYETRICYGYVRGALKYVVVMTPNATSNGVFEYTSRGEIITSNSTYYETPTSKAVYEFVAEQISSLVGSAPETLDTIEELSAALNNNPDILDLLATKEDLNDIDAKIDDIAKNQLNDLLSDVMTEEGKSGEKVEVPTSQAVQAELNIVNTKIEDLLEYTNEHLGDITDLITDKMTEEGLEGTNKVELPTARAINDYVENKLSNYTTQATQVQIITWEEKD